ncbi:putative WPP domain interacting protein 1 [Hibiscus syriacus]|uniref:WPP domain interacting protein 1 n=1 Tax=Hibiscus syriacus TaxID=106335 RepID=A0A6A3AUH9_HIBSY|nr:putative WPP domain interacting protein 1 [Hibiscus syriacus]
MDMTTDEEEEASVSSGNSRHSLTIKTTGRDKDALALMAKDLLSSSLKSSMESYPYNSPSLVSPPSSAFVSALQSPYISPRATIPKPQEGSQSDDVPSSSYTPPSDLYEYSDDPTDPKPKFVTCVPVPDPGPRISFSFPVPQISFTKAPVSPASNAKLRSCDVLSLASMDRILTWVVSVSGLNRSWSFKESLPLLRIGPSIRILSHEIADRVICSVTYGVVVVTTCSFLNHLSLEEIRFFAQKNLIPLFFGTGLDEITGLLNCTDEKNTLRSGLDRSSCVAKTAAILRAKLGRKILAEKDFVDEGFQKLPFPRNRYFVGREKEIVEIESALFGVAEQEHCRSMPIIEGEEFGKSKEPTLEAWVEPIVGRSSMKRSKFLKSKSGNFKSLGSSVICINGVPGIGKTELALEFAYRYSQRHKTVLWVGGEARYLWQNILNLSLNLGLDVSAKDEKQRGRIRSFEEQEFEAFKRVKSEVFRDMPYLLIIDNLETEREWREGKDLHDLIPRTTGGSHVIITTRLQKVMNFDIMQLLSLPLSDAIILVQGRRKRDYPSDELEFLRKFDEKLGRLSFGLWIIGALLSELPVLQTQPFPDENSIFLLRRLASRLWEKE